MARIPSYATRVPEEKITMIGGFPTPPAQPVMPLHALVSVFRLIANKEDTRQVFEIVSALAGGSGLKMFQRFVATDYGRRVVSEPIRLEQILGDRDYLRAMPDGSFGRAYLAFMEGENLTPEGITEAAEEAGMDYTSPTQFEELRRMFLHVEVQHDLWHVLTGYGRDALGEICNLGFTRAQTRNPGFRLIIWIGALVMKLERPSLPIWKAVDEGVEIGKNAAWMLEQDFTKLLPLPLSEVRRKLNFAEPSVYNSVPDEVKAGLLKPRVRKTQAEREAKAAAGAAAVQG